MRDGRSPGPGAPQRGSLAQLVVLGVLWGALFPITKLGIDAGANPFALVTVDFLLAAAVAFGVAAAIRVQRPTWRSLAESAGIGALMIGGINLPLFWGEQFVTGGAASIVYATSPAISLLFLVALHRAHRPGALRIAALGIGLSGVLVLSLAAGAGGPVTNPWGLVAFGLGATCQGIGAVLISIRRPNGEGHWGQAAQFAGAGAVGLAVMGVLSAPLALPMTTAVIASVLYMGLVSLVIGYTLFFGILRRSGPVSANLVTFINPVVALAVGVLAFGESFRTIEIVGLALVLLALALLERHDRVPAPAPASGLGTPGSDS